MNHWILDVVYAVLHRPGRTALSTLGIVLGIGSLVAIIGVSQTSASAVGTTFDALRATAILVTPNDPDSPLPVDGPERVAGLNGVRHAYTLTQVQLNLGPAGRLAGDPPEPLRSGVTVYAVSGDLLDSPDVTIPIGRGFDHGHMQRRDQIAVLGTTAASRLGIHGVLSTPGIGVADRRFAVGGIVSEITRHPELLNSALVPLSTAIGLGLVSGPTSLVVVAEFGAVDLVAQQVPLALSPERPSAIRVRTPLQPVRLRASVIESVDVLTLSVAGITLVVSIFGIASIALVAVMERSGEIGLRRALGASRTAVAAQLSSEYGLIGLAGGLIGTALGYSAVIALSAARSWTPVIEPVVPLLAPALGLVAALIATIYPTMRAVRIEPAAALSSGVK